MCSPEGQICVLLEFGTCCLFMLNRESFSNVWPNSLLAQKDWDEIIVVVGRGRKSFGLLSETQIQSDR